MMTITDRLTALRPYLPWTTKRGRLDGLRLAAFLAAVGPGLWIAYLLETEPMAAEPISNAIHRVGDWTLYFLLATLAVTPLKRLFAWARLTSIRRLLGVTVFCYAAAHLVLYAADQAWDLGHVASEIVSRFYLTIGFIVLVGFAALAVTSFDGAIRRMKRNWKRLHKAVYPLAALGLVHYFLQSRLDVYDPVLLSGLFVGLMLHRVPGLLRLPASVGIVGIAVVSGLAAAGIEYGWYATMTGIPADRVLLSNLDFSYQIRPMWVAMLIMAAPLPVRLARSWGPRVAGALRFGPRMAVSE